MEIKMKDLREDSDLKQREIAEFLKIPRSTYASYESKDYDIPLEICNKIANYHHVSLDYLLGISNKNVNTLRRNINFKLLAKRLKIERRKRKLTQKSLGQKIGFFQQTYSNYEIGISKPTTYKLFLIAKFYNISMDYLVGRTDIRKIK